jgi:hypothetical protein
MPIQTTKKNVRIADGCRISVKKTADENFLDLGVVQGDYVATLQYDEENIEFANATPLKRKSNMRIEGSFTMGNLEGECLEKISNGIVTRVATPGDQVLSADFDTQVIDGFALNTPIELAPVVTATGVAIKFSEAPVIASIVTNDTPPGTLVADDDYFIIANANSHSGYSVMFNGSGSAGLDGTEELTITYGDNTPVASETLYCGTSSFTATPYAMRIQHFTSSGAPDYTLDLYNVYTSPGSYNFGLKGADTGGIDTMEITFAAELDETKTDGRQLLSVTKNV